MLRKILYANIDTISQPFPLNVGSNPVMWGLLPWNAIVFAWVPPEVDTDPRTRGQIIYLGGKPGKHK